MEPAQELSADRRPIENRHPRIVGARWPARPRRTERAKDAASSFAKQHFARPFPHRGTSSRTGEDGWTPCLRPVSGWTRESSVPLLRYDSQIGANLRVCADEEDRA